MNVESQIEGAAVQGLGQALYEEFKMDRGRTLNPDFVDYRMPLATEAPEIKVAHIITDDPDGPFGAKEASEGAIVCSPPSIVSAIVDAIGGWITSLPVTPEKVLKALKDERAREATAAAVEVCAGRGAGCRSLNRAMNQLPEEVIEYRRHIARWVDERLCAGAAHRRRVGLRPRAPARARRAGLSAR